MAFSTEGIKISDVRLINSTPPSWKDDKLEIEIKYGKKTTANAQSAIGKGDQHENRMIWDTPFIFAGDITDDTLLIFIVRRKRVFKTIIFGPCERRAIDLLEQQGLCKLDGVGECQLTFNIEKVSEHEVVLGLIEKASAGLGSLPTLEAPGEVANVVNSVAQAYNDDEKTWVPFLDTFQAFMQVMNGVSEINIYVQVAWSVLSIIPKTIIAKKNRDDKIKQLCEKLKDIYEYITDAERLCDLNATQSTARSTTRWSKMLYTLVQQTVECAYFLSAYGTESTAPAKNIVKAIGGSVDVKIQAFNDKLDHLTKVMTDSVDLETGIVTLRVSEKISESNELALLGEMPYDSDAGFLPKKQCLPGTRQTLINEILKWINDDSLPHILVLSGQAGIGKSAVAHTIAGTFQKQNRLGSMFCFNGSFPDRRNCLFSTISRDLADSDTFWRKELVKAIDKSTIRKKKDAETQFDELILKPSKNVAIIGSVVVVVDALDESGERNERREILKLLLDRWSELPKNYRIIVTTRPEQDIELQCQNCSVQCIRMGDIQDPEETCSDIQAYVSVCLAPISSILDTISWNWPSVLAERAEGLFQWAQTVCQFIDPTVRRPQIVKKKWKACISNSSSSLYGLYRQIISSQSEAEDIEFVEDFKTIVGVIITAREPLSIDALQNIFDDIEDIESILTPFGSFFIGVHDLSTPVRPVHTSLFDFFSSQKIIGEDNEYYIDTSNQTRMALGCLKVMAQMLCFNICQLETSHKRNEDVPDFRSRVKKVIPLHLSYSCRFWTAHLQSSTRSEELICEVRKLMDDNLLHLFEALSLLNAVECGCTAMREIVDWCQNGDKDLAEDAMDAAKFGYDFGDMIVKSTPHLYLSALPFAPRDSFVSRRYLERYPGLFTFDFGQPIGSASRKIGFTKAGAFDMQIAFSPKGRYVATKRRCGVINVWDYVTGAKVLYHLAERSAKRSVCNIVFSPDGELVYCCYVDGDILIWSMGTKEKRIENHKETISAECRYCAISSDGCFIAWLTANSEILLFDRESHGIVKRFKYYRYFFAFSPNGDWIVFYGDTNKVYIWNTRNQTQHVIPYYARWKVVLLTDSYVAFQKDDTSIEIRDVQTNIKVTEIRHESSIASFCLSPDNRYILVASARMYLIRSVSTGELITRSYEDEYIRCLGFSYDSKLIASLRSDYTDDLSSTLHVRQWDESVEPNHPRGNEIKRVSEIWLRGPYLIIRYVTVFLDKYHLQISEIATTNTIIFDVELGNYYGPVDVSPDEENVRLAYGTSRGLCLWNDKEGEIIVDESVRSITTPVCLDSYLIAGDEKTIKIWDICTRKLICGPIDLPYELKFLFPVRGTCFAVVYDDDKAEVRDCESDGKTVGDMFTFETETRNSPIAVSANGQHVICASGDSLNILDSTGARLSSIPFSYCHPKRRLSLNGKYIAWTDNHGIKLFDVDTKTFLTGPLLTQPVQKLWFANDSTRIIMVHNAHSTDGCLDNEDWNASGTSTGIIRPGLIDIWDIQSTNTIIRTIRYPLNSYGINTLALSDRHLAELVDVPWRCSVRDLSTYEAMSTLYDSLPLAANGSEIERTLVSDKMEILNYALTAWKKASLPAFPKMKDGWVLGLQGELLFWVPERKRRGFWYPCTMHIPLQDITRLDFNDFVHGPCWTKRRSKYD